MFNSMEKNKMKKLVFLMMLFSLMVVFSGSASAQLEGGVVAPCGPGLFKPVKGQQFRLAVYTPINKSLPKMMLLTIGGESKDKPVCNARLQVSQDNLNKIIENNKNIKGGAARTGTVKTANNFPNGIKTSDTGILVAVNETSFKVTFSRGNQFLGEMMLDAIKRK